MMRFVLLMLIVAVLNNHQVSSTIVLADFQQQALTEHNLKRELHCTGPLALDSTINTIAQNYSNYLAANNLFQHSGTPGLGENLWYISSSTPITFVNGSSPTDSWYSEISSYNYSSPGFSSATGHFTQVVWENSTLLGIGIALTNNSLAAYVVANYSPQGNVAGEFTENVLPLCWDNMGGD